MKQGKVETMEWFFEAHIITQMCLGYMMIAIPFIGMVMPAIWISERAERRGFIAGLKAARS